MRSPPNQSCQTPAAAARPCGARPRGRRPRRRWLGAAPVPGASGVSGAAAAAADGAWAALVRLFPEDLEATARATGALQRRRGVDSAAALLWLVLAYAVGDWSLRLVAAVAVPRRMGDLSHVAVRARLRAARPWVAHLVSTLLGLTRAAAVATSAAPGAALRLRLVDATTSNAPGNTGTDWRVHASVWVAPDGPPRLDHLDLTDAHGAESLRRHPVLPGDVLVADRGHARRADLGVLLATPTAAAAAADPPVRVLVRIGWQNLPLQHPPPAPTPVDLVGWLPTLAGPTERAVVAATPRGHVPLRLVALPLPGDAAAAARRRLRRQARKKGRTPDARSLLAAGYVLLVTNLPADRWDTAAVLALYRVRWQVELVFKRLKGLWHLDRLRAHDPALAQVYLLGTLLGALLADRAAAPGGRRPAAGTTAAAWFLATDRPVSLWRWTALWQTSLLAALLGAVAPADLLATLPQLRRHVCDPPRRRHQQAAHARARLQAAAAAVPCVS